MYETVRGLHRKMRTIWDRRRMLICGIFPVTLATGRHVRTGVLRPDKVHGCTTGEDRYIDNDGHLVHREE